MPKKTAEKSASKRRTGAPQRRVGRPSYAPTEASRRRITILLANRWTQDEIAADIGIDAKTLRAYYRDLLDTGAARAKADLLVKLYDVAMGNGSGSIATRIFLGKCLCGLQERAPAAPPPPAPLPPIDLTKLSEVELERVAAIYRRFGYEVGTVADAGGDHGGDQPASD